MPECVRAVRRLSAAAKPLLQIARFRQSPGDFAERGQVIDVRSARDAEGRIVTCATCDGKEDIPGSPDDLDSKWRSVQGTDARATANIGKNHTHRAVLTGIPPSHHPQ